MAGKLKDISNIKYNRLTVISLAYTKNRKSYWNCICECGSKLIVRSDSIQSGKTKHCGCILQKRLIKHGLSGSKIYHVWASMKNRCNNSKSSTYEYYGARGITVDKKWNLEDGFPYFYEWAINNGYDEGLTLDRINVNGNYEPENCRWISQKEQMCNTRSNINIEYKNKIQNITQWAKEYDLKVDTLYARLSHGWNIEKALITPVRVKCRD